MARPSRYGAATYGWVDADQERFFREGWQKRGPQRVLEDQGAIVAAWLFERKADHLFLGFVEVASSHQGRGIGTRIVRTFLADAAREGLAARLAVMKANPRAMHLYERLGFTAERETLTHVWMIARSAAPRRDAYVEWVTRGVRARVLRVPHEETHSCGAPRRTLLSGGRPRREPRGPHRACWSLSRDGRERGRPRAPFATARPDPDAVHE